MLKVYGGFDPVIADHVIAFRRVNPDQEQTHRGVVVDGRIRYEPPTEANMRPTFTLSREECEALAKHLYDYGFTPKEPETVTPLRAHLADAIGVRDRLLAMVERSK